MKAALNSVGNGTPYLSNRLIPDKAPKTTILIVKGVD